MLTKTQMTPLNSLKNRFPKLSSSLIERLMKEGDDLVDDNKQRFTEQELKEGLSYLLEHDTQLAEYKYTSPKNSDCPRYDPFFHPYWFHPYLNPSPQTEQARKEARTAFLVTLIGLSIIGCWWFTALNFKSTWDSQESTEIKALKTMTSVLVFTSTTMIIGGLLAILGICSVGWAIGISLLIASAAIAVSSYLLKQHDTSPEPSQELLGALQSIRIFLKAKLQGIPSLQFNDPFGRTQNGLDALEAYKDCVREIVLSHISCISKQQQPVTHEFFGASPPPYEPNAPTSTSSSIILCNA